MIQVTLPTMSVTLNHLSASILQSIIDSGSEGITAQKLSGKLSTKLINECLTQLREAGAVFDTSTTLYQDSTGMTYKSVKRYIYKRWI